MEELQQLQTAFNTLDSITLAHLLNPFPESDEFDALSEFAHQNSYSIAQVGAQLFPQDRNIADLITSYLTFARDFNESGQALSNYHLMVDLFK